MKFQLTGIILFFLSNTCFSATVNSDWPMWRYDAGRTGFAEVTLPEKPSLLWTRQLEEPKRCWPFQFEDHFTGGNPDKIGKLSFDLSYEPVVGEGKLFVPSMLADKVTAYSAENGEEIWRFYAGGPVRFAPVYNSGRVWFISDDGYLYCLDAEAGELLWRYKGSYSDRMVLGNERVISVWPARGGPVFHDGVIYFAAGVIPFEGTFIHAVNANTGEKIWTNSTSGSQWSLHQHGGAYSYGGPSPQGYLALSGDKLIVPGGRTPPAVYDRHTGEFLYFNQASGTVGKGAGGYRAFTSEEWYFNHGMLYSLEDGAQYGHVPGDVITGKAFIGKKADTLVAHYSDVKKTEVEVADRLERGAIRKIYEVEEQWKVEMEGLDRLWFATGSHFVISKNDGHTAALVAVSTDGSPGRTVWETDVDEEIWSIFGGNEQLFIVTLDGKIYCFGTPAGNTAIHHRYNPEVPETVAEKQELALSIIGSSEVNSGYGLICGETDIKLILELVNNSTIHFVVVQPEAGKREQMKRYFDDAGLYGRRIAIVNEEQKSTPFLPYLYSLIVANNAEYLSDEIQKIYHSLRPYGGTACFLSGNSEMLETESRISLKNSHITSKDGLVYLTRKGSLPGSDQWTHQYGSAANRTYSGDELVKPPLGTLWFGGPSNFNALPRHHNGPIPQVAGGRLFILGMETISARCVYTGRELWVHEIPGIGHPFTDLELEEKFWSGQEVYMSNHPGANFIGSPYVSGEEEVYVIHKDRLLTLDAATGDIRVEFRLPSVPDIEVPEFGHIVVSGEYMILTIDPQLFDDGLPGKDKNWNATSSTTLLVMNRHSGEILWTLKAKTGFRHNAIVAGAGRLFLVDGLSEVVAELLQRRGLMDEVKSELKAFDLRTGKELWAADEKIFGTWLGYYEDKDILLQGGRLGQRGPLADEPGDRLIAHSALTGEILWEKNRKYSGPLGLHPDMIITGRPGEAAINPLTGEDAVKNHPVTGEEYTWDWHKYYGCGTMNSSKYLITFRSSSAGYNDLLNFGGTGNISGWKAGCTNNLIAADGLLNGPDYTRTCTCSYPLQSSFGLVHMPDAVVEMWTLNRLDIGSEAIKALGINFGAPGNRRENGVLWFEYPKVYPEGPDISVSLESGLPEWFKHHASWIKNPENGYNWVASYGMQGVSSVSVKLNPGESQEEHTYTVKLFFAEPDNLQTGERIFDVALQGEKVIEQFDIAAETGGPKRTITKEFKNIKVKDELKVDFTGIKNKPVISGIEIVMDGFNAKSAMKLR